MSRSLALIVTVFNEADNIEAWLLSYARQSVLADECLIVDAGSTDGTWEILRACAKQQPQLRLRLWQRPSNRAQARNFAIRHTQCQYLAMTDAGCVLDPEWLAQLWQVQQATGAEVVGGFFQGLPAGPLAEAMTPFFLQLRVAEDGGDFLPTTRSVLVGRAAWEQAGGFNERLILSEDYDFFRRLRRAQHSFAFARQALVSWRGPATGREFVSKLAAFASSDIEAGILRGKVVLLLLRYLFALLILFSPVPWLLAILLPLYCFWSIHKHRSYLPRWWWLLPVLQISADLAVMWGTLRALPQFKTRAP